MGHDLAPPTRSSRRTLGIGEYVIAGLVAALILAGTITWIEWPATGGTPRPSLDIVYEILHSRLYDDVSSTSSAERDILVAQGERPDHLPVIRITSWKSWSDADRAVGIPDSRALPVGSCHVGSTPNRTTCVVAERTTAAVGGPAQQALATLRRLAGWLWAGQISGAGPWDGRTIRKLTVSRRETARATLQRR
jgi:hypothetical protein